MSRRVMRSRINQNCPAISSMFITNVQVPNVSALLRLNT